MDPWFFRIQHRFVGAVGPLGSLPRVHVPLVYLVSPYKAPVNQQVVYQGSLRKPIQECVRPSGRASNPTTYVYSICMYTLTNQNPLFCRAPIDSIYGSILRTYKILGSGWLRYIYTHLSLM